MACRNREESTMPVSLSDALLLAIMSIVGLPVEAHIKDGSVYSGIFHTASVEDDYGIVLKNARMTKKGKGDANIGSTNVIETLVVRSADLIKVAAKGTTITLPENGIACNTAGDSLKDTVNTNKESTQRKEACSALGIERQVEGDTLSQGDLCDDDVKSSIQKKEITHEVQCSDPTSTSPAGGSSFPQSKSVEEICSDLLSKLLPSGQALDHFPSSDKLNAQCQDRHSSVDSVCSNGVPSHVSTSPTSTEMLTPKNSTTESKGSKLNPGAKIFWPSFTNHRSATPPVPKVANLAYVPDTFIMGPIASPQPDEEINAFVPRSSLSAKFAPYYNVAAGNGFNGSQYSQPFIGDVEARTQAVRYCGQHLHTLHAGPTCMNSDPQNAMVGRVGQQLIYVHPVSHNQASGAFSQVPTRLSVTPHLGHLLKHQGTATTQPALQLYVNPPFISPDGHLPIAAQSHHSSHALPPFPIIHPIAVPGSNGIFSTKF